MPRWLRIERRILIGALLGASLLAGVAFWPQIDETLRHFAGPGVATTCWKCGAPFEEREQHGRRNDGSTWTAHVRQCPHCGYVPKVHFTD